MDLLKRRRKRVARATGLVDDKPIDWCHALDVVDAFLRRHCDSAFVLPLPVPATRPSGVQDIDLRNGFASAYADHRYIMCPVACTHPDGSSESEPRSSPGQHENGGSGADSDDSVSSCPTLAPSWAPRCKRCGDRMPHIDDESVRAS